MGGDQRIGTTLRGIGPCYVTKAARCGIRVGDLLDKDTLSGKLEIFLKEWKDVFERTGMFSGSDLTHEYHSIGMELEPYIGDVSEYLHHAFKAGKSILFEGAQGTMLDIDHGTYPFVTSSNSTIGGVCSGLGISTRMVQRVVGITKAYTTRVGEGPFPTEVEGETGETIRRRGNEFGASTGRPRRCGWLDIPVLRYSCRINGIDQIAMTQFDVLDNFETIKVCTGYTLDDKTYDTIPWETGVFRRVKPIVEDPHQMCQGGDIIP